MCPAQINPQISERERCRNILKEAVDHARRAYEFTPNSYTYAAYTAIREAYHEFSPSFRPPEKVEVRNQPKTEGHEK